MFKNMQAEDSVFQGFSPASARRQRGTTVCLHWLRRLPGLRPSRGPRARRIGGTLLSPSLPGRGLTNVWMRCCAQPDLGKSELL